MSCQTAFLIASQVSAEAAKPKRRSKAEKKADKRARIRGVPEPEAFSAAWMAGPCSCGAGTRADCITNTCDKVRAKAAAGVASGSTTSAEPQPKGGA